MKRIVCIIFAAILSLSLFGCGSNNAHKNHSESPTDDVSSDAQKTQENEYMIIISVNGRDFSADIVKNSSGKAFTELLKDGPLTISMSDYGNFEKVGPLSVSLPRNDERITTEPGDVILYQGNSITIYYDTNTWTFTRLGKIRDVDKETLKNVLGSGNASVTFSLAERK